MKYVCSLEHAKKLEALGVKRDSYFCYTETTDGDYSVCHADTYMRYQGSIPAYTVGELGEMLPPFESGPTETGGFWVICDGAYEMSAYTTGVTEADARAKMLIWLIENGQIKAGEL